MAREILRGTKTRLRISQQAPNRRLMAAHSRLLAPQVVGDLTAGDPPVPIPNTEVKPRRADGTARAKCVGA
jgi:hypothetical protein